MSENNLLIFSISNAEVYENASNGTFVGRLYSHGLGQGTYTYKLLDDADGRFKLIGDQLVVANGEKLDFETAMDHQIKVLVTDSQGVTAQHSFAICVFDEPVENDAPAEVVIGMPENPEPYPASTVVLMGSEVEDHTPNGVAIGYFSSQDFNSGSLSYKLIDDADGRFAIVDGQLIVADGSKLNFETAMDHEIKVLVTDSSGVSTSYSYSIAVLHDSIMAGTRGSDTFTFNSKVSSGSFTRIENFSVKADSIRLENEIFKKLGSKTGTVKQDFFTIGSKAIDKNDYLVYNKKTGALYYDANGSDKGGAIKIAELDRNLKMTYKDFFVI